LAKRIARNREIAGLHYPSDSVAGESVAQQLFDKLTDEAVMGGTSGNPSKIGKLITEAKAEWA
jgi:hypothetical protein